MNKQTLLASQGFKEEDIKECSYTFDKDNIYLTVRISVKEHVCPHCGTLGYNIKDYKVREYRGLNFGLLETYITEYYPRLKCMGCGKSYTPKKEERAIHGISLEYNKAIIKELKELRSLSSIARSFSVSIDTIISILDNQVDVDFAPMDIAFCIDEFHYKKGSMKDFCCMILDTITHKVIRILHNNKTATIEKYFASIPVENRLKVRYISTDMNYSYISLCVIYIPRATIAYDPYHYISAFGKVVVDVCKRVAEFPSSSVNLKWLAKNPKLLVKKIKDLKVDSKKFDTSVIEPKIRSGILNNFDLHMSYEYYQIFCYDFANIKSIKQARKSLANLINILWVHFTIS